MATRYALTCRPAWAENVPDGFTNLKASVAPRAGYHGFVEYAEPLPRERAEHFSLTPLGPEITYVVVDGDRLHPSEVAGADWAQMAYDLGTGQTTVEAVREYIENRCAEFEVQLEEIAVYEPPPID